MRGSQTTFQAATVAAVDSESDAEYKLVDSGAAEHVCPIDFGTSVVDRPAAMALYDISGNRIPAHGSKEMTLQLAGTRKIRIETACVSRPVLSIGRLAQGGDLAVD